MVNLKEGFDKAKWPGLFFLWLTHGLIALWQFVASDSFEYSARYLSISLILLSSIVLFFILAVVDFKNIAGWVGWKEKLRRPNVRDFLLLSSLVLILIRGVLWYLSELLGQELAIRIGGYIEILHPVLNMLTYISVETFLLTSVANVLPYFPDIKNIHYSVKCFGIVLFVLWLIVLIISKTGLGIDSSYRGDWQRGLPSVPFLEWQLILAGMLCAGMLFFEAQNKIRDFHRFDVLFCIGIWAGACVFWLSQPVVLSPSALEPHEPNFEIYPFIDAQTYDALAQSILIGNGFGQDQIPQRPAYIVFLALGHTLVGQDYSSMVIFQTVVFAFFPVLLYLLGRDLFGRPVGVAVALLAILRDYTSNLVSPFTGNLSYSKLYLSEIPIAMLLVLLLFLGIRWIRYDYSFYTSILIGGMLGVAMLIRTQAIVFVPVIAIFSILSKPQKIRPMVKKTVFILLAVAIVISPWLWRNWKIAGGIVFDNPESQTMNLALRYSRVNGYDQQITRLPNETSAEFSNRLEKIAIEAVLSNPSGAVWALTNSFINHGVNNILLMPLRNEIGSFKELIIPTKAFWEEWEGTPTSFQKILLGVYLFLFGLGLTAAWLRNRWIGLLPLGLNLAYNLWTSIALLSGQRFMLSMDWSIYLYYCFGIFSLISFFLFLINRSRSLLVKWMIDHPFDMEIPVEHVKWSKGLIAAIFFFGVGLSLPITENIFPSRYPNLSREQLIAAISASSELGSSSITPACIKKIAGDQQLKIIQGRALYPRYYSAGDGEDFTDTPGYKTINEGRLVFDIVGQENHRVIFPLSQSPTFFPHASDVTLVYNQRGDLWFVLVKKDQTEGFYVSDIFDKSVCY